MRGAINEPKGVQKPHPPIWIGGGGEKVTLKLVAKYGDACNIGGFDPEVYRHKFERGEASTARTWAATTTRSCGRARSSSISPTTRSRSTATSPACRRSCRTRSAAASSSARPETIKAKLQELVDAGVQYFIAYLFNATRLEPLQRFAAEVMPAFR